MTTKHFATLGVRLVGLLAIVIGVVFVASSGIALALVMGSLTRISTSNPPLHDTYYVIGHGEAAWLTPGVVCTVIGVLLLVMSRRLGTWLAWGTEGGIE